MEACLRRGPFKSIPSAETCTVEGVDRDGDGEDSDVWGDGGIGAGAAGGVSGPIMFCF